MRSRKTKYKVTLTREEARILRDGLLWWRNEVIRKGIPTDDIDAVLKRLL